MARAQRHYIPGYVWHITQGRHNKDSHYKWVESALQTDNRDKENQWTQSIAVGSKAFVEQEAINRSNLRINSLPFS